MSVSNSDFWRLVAESRLFAPQQVHQLAADFGHAQPPTAQPSAAAAAQWLVGRNVLFPGPEDPLVVASAAGSIIHHNLTVEDALKKQESRRGRDLNQMAAYFERLARE